MKNEIYIGITGNRDISEEQIVFIKERIDKYNNRFVVNLFGLRIKI